MDNAIKGKAPVKAFGILYCSIAQKTKNPPFLGRFFVNIKNDQVYYWPIDTR